MTGGEDQDKGAKRAVNKAKLTDGVAKAASAGEREYLIWDSEIAGFGLRVTPGRRNAEVEERSGVKSWILNYRARGVQRQYTFGRYPAWSAAAAREKAKLLRRRVDDGGDPMEEREAEREAPTVKDLCDFYEQNWLVKKRAHSQLADKLAITKYIIPEMGQKKVYAIRHADVAALHRRISVRYKTGANRIVSLLSKMFSLAIQQGWRPESDNPCKGVERNPEEGRERFLTEDETARLWEALDQSNHPSAAAVKLLLLTGARRGEVLSAAWDQFDLDTGIWVKPSSHTKQRKTHRIPLATAALDILYDIKAKQDERITKLKEKGIIAKPEKALFPGRTQDVQTSLRSFWTGVCKQAGMVEWRERRNAKGATMLDKDKKPIMIPVPTARVHDLRHSAASYMASSGLSLPVIGRMLGHTQAQTTSRYSHLLDDPLRAAAESVAGFVKNAKPKVASLDQARQAKQSSE